MLEGFNFLCLETEEEEQEEEQEEEGEEEAEEEEDGAEYETLSPCRHRFEINEPICRVCSGLPRGVCALYAP